MDPSRIRNFSIIAHIDHGKSTLSDRILEMTGAVDARDMREQYLDSMDLERERGITIKAQNVRVDVEGPHPPPHRHARPRRLRLRGQPLARRLRGRRARRRRRPGHRGADAGQLLPGPGERPRDRRRAQQDRPAGRRPRHATRTRSSGCSASPPTDILRISAKTGEGVAELLDAVIARIPPPVGDPDGAAPGPHLRLASTTSTAGVVSSMRVMNGRLGTGDRLRFMQAGHGARRRRDRRPAARCRRRWPSSGPGEVGYLIAGIKDVGEARSGETVTAGQPARRRSRCPATRTPSRWCSAASTRSTATTSSDLRESLDRLKLNDASITYVPETSGALGFGFRCGFLGLLHMEIVRERLEREFDLALIATAPVGRVPGAPHRRHDAGRRQPGRHAAGRRRSTTSKSPT